MGRGSRELQREGVGLKFLWQRFGVSAHDWKCAILAEERIERDEHGQYYRAQSISLPAPATGRLCRGESRENGRLSPSRDAGTINFFLLISSLPYNIHFICNYYIR